MEMGQGLRDEGAESRREDSIVYGPPSGELYPDGWYADHPWQLKPTREERPFRRVQRSAPEMDPLDF